LHLFLRLALHAPLRPSLPAVNVRRLLWLSSASVQLSHFLFAASVLFFIIMFAFRKQDAASPKLDHKELTLQKYLKLSRPFKYGTFAYTSLRWF